MQSTETKHEIWHCGTLLGTISFNQDTARPNALTSFECPKCGYFELDTVQNVINNAAYKKPA